MLVNTRRHQKVFTVNTETQMCLDHFVEINNSLFTSVNRENHGILMWFWQFNDEQGGNVVRWLEDLRWKWFLNVLVSYDDESDNLKNNNQTLVTMGQVGQLILLQDSLYFFMTPSSTIHSQCVHTSIIIFSPACTQHTDRDGSALHDSTIQSILIWKTTLQFCMTYSYHSVVDDTGIHRSCTERKGQTRMLLAIHWT